VHRRREEYNRDEEKKKWKSEREKACAQLEMKEKKTMR